MEILELATDLKGARDEINRLRVDYALLADDYMQLLGDVERLRAELAEVKRDAERYRLLRKQQWNTSKFAVACDPKNSIKLGYDSPSLERLDDLIDSELSQEQK